MWRNLIQRNFGEDPQAGSKNFIPSSAYNKDVQNTLLSFYVDTFYMVTILC